MNAAMLRERVERSNNPESFFRIKRQALFLILNWDKGQETYTTKWPSQSVVSFYLFLSLVPQHGTNKFPKGTDQLPGDDCYCNGQSLLSQRNSSRHINKVINVKQHTSQVWAHQCSKANHLPTGLAELLVLILYLQLIKVKLALDIMKVPDILL